MDFRRFRLVVFFLCLADAGAARADALCDYYRKNSPSMYKILCGGGSSSSKPAGASSTFSSAFNLSSASLPTEPSSYGLEILGHRIRENGEWSPTFSLVKGFQKFGTGISTGGNNTFYGDDVVQRLNGSPDITTFDPPEKPRGTFTNLNIGTAFSLLKPKSGPQVRVGLSARYNRVTNSWGGGPALLFNWTNLTLGAGFTQERISNGLPRIRFISYQASARLWIFEFQYDLLTDDQPGLRPVQIGTVTTRIRNLVLTAAARKLNYVQAGGGVTQQHYAIQYLFSKHVSAGLLWNYIPGTTSVGFQYFL